MHHATVERIQQRSRPHVAGDLNVYFALAALALTVAIPSPVAHLVALSCFVALGLDAVGRSYLVFLRVPAYFLVPSLLVLLLFTQGDPIASLGPLAVSDAGVARTVETGLRSYASVAVLSYLVVTTPVPALFAALRRLRLPDFVLEFALLTYRGIQLLLAESERLYTATRARLGHVDRRALFRSTKYVAYSLFLQTLSRADAMERSMRARGYDGRMPLPDRESAGHGTAAAVLALVVLAGWLP